MAARPTDTAWIRRHGRASIAGIGASGGLIGLLWFGVPDYVQLHDRQIVAQREQIETEKRLEKLEARTAEQWQQIQDTKLELERLRARVH